MFDIKFYKNLSNSNVVTKDISLVSTVQGVLREPASIMDPVLVVDTIQINFDIVHCNYLYIAPLNRYYYITDIISVANSLWEVHCHVDVLMTYADEIREQTAIVSRQELKFNMYLDDGIFMSYQNPLIQTKVFSNPTPFEQQEFVLIVAGS